MKQSKKSIARIGLAIVAIMLILVIGIFLFIFYDQAIGQFLIDPLHNISVNLASDGLLGVGYNETLQTLKTDYDNRLIPYDIYFIFLFLIAFISSSISASRAKKQGIFTFFGYIFILSMIFLLIMFFIGQFTDYFVTNIFIPLFNDTTLDIPLILYFFNNINIVAFIWFMWLGLVNQIDFKQVIESRSSGGFRR